MAERTERLLELDVGRYLRAILRPGELAVEVGSRTILGDELSRDTGIRLLHVESSDLNEMMELSAPRLVCVSSGTDPETVASGGGRTIERHRPLVLVETPTEAGEDRSLRLAGLLDYPLAARAVDGRTVLLLDERDIGEALDVRTAAGTEEPVGAPDLAASLAGHTQQLRRLEAELVSLKRRIDNGFVPPGSGEAGERATALSGGERRSRGGRLQRKYRKLRADPRRFFEDSRSPLVREVLGRLYLALGPRRTRTR